MSYLPDVMNTTEPRDYRFVAATWDGTPAWAAQFAVDGQPQLPILTTPGEGNPNGIVPQQAFGVVHDMIDHAELDHVFDLPGEIRAFGSMLYRCQNHMSNQELASSLGGVLRTNVGTFFDHYAHTRTTYSHYTGVDERAKMITWECLSYLGWPGNLPAPWVHSLLCDGAARAAAWWNSASYNAEHMPRELIGRITGHAVTLGSVLVVTLHGGYSPRFDVRVDRPNHEEYMNAINQEARRATAG